MKLQLRTVEDGKISLSIGIWFRLSLFIISGVVAGALITSPAAGPLIFFLLALFGALYEERWIFSDSGIESRNGLLFLSRKQFWNISTVDELQLTSFTKGKSSGISPGTPFLPSYAVLSFVTHEGDRKTLEVLPLRKKAELERKAVRIADRCGLSFINKTETG